MGSLVTRLLYPLSPLVENHRVVGAVDHGSAVDEDNEATHRLQKMLEWCRKKQGDDHILLKRNLIQLPGSTGATNGHCFRIMQWNILADALGSGKDHFIKCPPEAMKWKRRKRHLLEEMLTYSPDIICCQEVDHYDDFFEVQLSKVGYRGAFLPKPWSPCLDVQPNNGPDGCAIFYKTQNFELLDYKAVTLKTLTFWTNHVALFYLLKFKGQNDVSDAKDSVFLIGTTHLKAKLGYERLRASQGKDILRFLQQYAESDVPIILCGDFNATPDEEVYRNIKDCKTPVFESAYTFLNGQKSEPPYTTWCIRANGETPKTVDYLFYTKSKFDVRSILEMPSSEEIGPNRLPSLNYPSDHLSLVCDLEFISSSEDSTGPEFVPKM